MDIVPRTVEYYYTTDGKCPYKEWFAALKDANVRQAVDARLTRARRGLFGDCDGVGHGVWEFRLNIGPGYRVYFGQQAPSMIVLLGGGHKKTQNQDINRARDYWADYQERLR